MSQIHHFVIESQWMLQFLGKPGVMIRSYDAQFLILLHLNQSFHFVSKLCSFVMIHSPETDQRDIIIQHIDVS